MAMSRAEVLARHDLRDLLDRFVGPGRGSGRNATWPCPSPEHGEQTGRTPPVTVFEARNGDQRWKCHSCGAGGTAIDLVCSAQGSSVAQAFETLAGAPLPQVRRPSLASERTKAPIVEDLAAIETWVCAAQRRLWGRPGDAARRWLAGRGLAEPILRANRVGYHVHAAAHVAVPGIPNTTGIVLPALDRGGLAIYGQLRSLRGGDGPKYLNPSSQLARPVKVTPVRLAALPATRQVVFVCEGMLDALTVAQAGWRACAVLGAGLAGERVAAELLRTYPGRDLVLAFDNDPAGRAAAQAIGCCLAGFGVNVREFGLPSAVNDINEFAMNSGPRALSDRLFVASAALHGPLVESRPSIVPVR